jgi:peptide/nickel transport system permease protein
VKPAVVGCLLTLAIIHAIAALADFVAPYEPSRQHREHAWSPPSSLQLETGGLLVTVETAGGRRERHPVRFWHRAPDGLHLFGVDEPAKIFLMGADELGRDQFSRLVHGARVSLFSGLFAALLSACLGICLGAVAGFAGGRPDWLVMRLVEVFLALPWMYLLLAARAFVPLSADPWVLFTAMMGLLGLIGWARPARLVRGIVLSAKERDFVLAARGFGASDIYLLRRHILPETFPTIAAYLSLAIPQYVLAETTLSFLGLGFGGAMPSWGSLLAALARLEVMESYWWMAVPAIVFVGVFACYNAIANGLTLRPAHRQGS